MRRTEDQALEGPERRVIGSGASTLRVGSGLAPPSRPRSPSRHEHFSAPAAPHSNDVTTDTATPGRRRSRSWGRRRCWAAGWSRCMWAAGSGRRSWSATGVIAGCLAPRWVPGARESGDGGSGGAGHDTCPTTGKEHPDADSLATNRSKRRRASPPRTSRLAAQLTVSDELIDVMARDRETLGEPLPFRANRAPVDGCVLIGHPSCTKLNASRRLAKPGRDAFRGAC